MNVFQMDQGARPKLAVKYRPLQVEVGGVKHTLAMHKLHTGCYRVSDPSSGRALLAVVHGGHFIGTKGLGVRAVQALAAEQVAALAVKIGASKFNEALATGVYAP